MCDNIKAKFFVPLMNGRREIYNNMENLANAQKYYLESTNDRTDRTTEIEAKLSEYGACLLGGGDFYVSGVKMPDGTSLMGMGTATRLFLQPEIESGFTVKIGSFSTIKDMFLCGSEEGISLGDTVGERHGILFKGTATTKDWLNQPKHSIIEACEIRSFTGGGLTCIDTGFSIRSALTASNCHIFNCGAGINIPHFSEYHEFTNILCCENIYGCINNGGNNVFVNCGFNSNAVAGYVIDNTDDKSLNNSHGSVVGCTFNHNGGDKGIAIQLIKATNGYVFTGCQVFYSKIIVENSTWITFDAFNFGKNQVIEVKDGKLVMFTSCAFHGEPSITVEENENVKFINCFLKDGTPVET